MLVRQSRASSVKFRTYALAAILVAIAFWLFIGRLEARAEERFRLVCDEIAGLTVHSSLDENRPVFRQIEVSPDYEIVKAYVSSSSIDDPPPNMDGQEHSLSCADSRLCIVNLGTERRFAYLESTSGPDKFVLANARIPECHDVDGGTPNGAVYHPAHRQICSASSTSVYLYAEYKNVEIPKTFGISIIRGTGWFLYSSSHKRTILNYTEFELHDINYKIRNYIPKMMGIGGKAPKRCDFQTASLPQGEYDTFNVRFFDPSFAYEQIRISSRAIGLVDAK